MSHRDPMRVQRKVDQRRVDAEVAGDLVRGPLLLDVELSQRTRVQFDASTAGRAGRADDVEAVVGTPTGHGGKSDVVGGRNFRSANNRCVRTSPVRAWATIRFVNCLSSNR